MATRECKHLSEVLGRGRSKLECVMHAHAYYLDGAREESNDRIHNFLAVIYMSKHLLIRQTPL